MIGSSGATDCPGGSGRQARSATPLMSEVRHRPRYKFAQGKINVLLCICLLVVLSLPVQVRSAVICAYADSSCSTCSDLCGVAQFYSLLPSPCRPESTVRPLHFKGSVNNTILCAAGIIHIELQNSGIILNVIES